MSEALAKTFLTGPQTARRYGIDTRSLHRWRNDPDLQFPEPMIVHGRLFFDLSALEQWERSRVTSNSNKKAA